MKTNKKKEISFDEKLANAKKILATKKINDNSVELFDRILKKAANPKPRSAK